MRQISVFLVTCLFLFRGKLLFFDEINVRFFLVPKKAQAQKQIFEETVIS